MSESSAVFRMDARSEATLVGVHPHLIRVIRRAAVAVPFLVIHGLRTLDEERANVAKGASQTLHSRHLPNAQGLACAVDVAALDAGHVTWDAPPYSVIWRAVAQAGAALSVPVEWGGLWTTLKDLGHFQLPWKDYP